MPSSSIAEQVFALLLRAYPRRFRQAFAPELTEFFRRDRLRAQQQGGIAVARMWAFTLVDLLGAAWRQRTGRAKSRDGRVAGRALATAIGSGAGLPGRGGADPARSTGSAAIPFPPTPPRNGAAPMSDLLQDVRYGLRSFVREPGFTLVAVLTLALGVGATTGVFSVIDGVLLRPLPYPDSDRLIYIGGLLPNNPDSLGPLSEGLLADFAASADTLELVAGSSDESFTMLGNGDPELIDGALVGEGFLAMLRVAPVIGRGFGAEDFAPGAPNVVLLQHGFWRERWGADPGAVGGTVTLNSEPYTIIGVLPSGFRPPEALFGQDQARLWAPLRFADPPVRTSFGYQGLARLADGAGIAAAAEQMDRIARLQTETYNLSFEVGAGAEGLHERTVQSSGEALWLLLLGVAFLLLIACANVANLMLARGTRRGRELAVRGSLGAGRWRIVRQLLTESVVLALAGGLAGTVLAYGAVRAFKAAGPGDVPRLAEVGVDLRVLLASMALSGAVGVLFGLAPALQAFRSDGAAALRATSAAARGSSAGAGTRGLLVATETALALILLIGAALLANSFVRLSRVDPGFDPEGLVGMRVNLRSAYPEQESWAPLFHQLLEGVESIPGVSSASVTTSLPFAGVGIMQEVLPLDAVDAEDPAFIPTTYVSRGHFRNMGMTLLEGADFDARASTAAGEVVINEALAARYWPNAPSVVGKRIRMVAGDGNEVVTVLGVVNSLRYRHDRDPMPELYFDMDARSWRSMWVTARTDGDPAAIAQPLREALWRIDDDLPVDRVAPVEQLSWSSIGEPRFYSGLAAALAGVAVALALVGIYGTLSYTVGSRVRELGIRMALGARPSGVVAMVLAGGLRLTLIGLLLGTAGAWAVTRLLERFLFGIEATDMPTFAAAALLFLATALLACWLPARRAARLDPVRALRSDV